MFTRHQAWRFTALLVVVLTTVVTTRPTAAQDQRCFPQTGQCISGRFREYWEQNGGLAVFGYPLTPARNERNRDTGQTYLTQWFERNRFEYQPNQTKPYDVLLGRLGDDQLIQQGLDWQTFPQGFQQGSCLWFAETRHSVCNQEGNVGFRAYWESHGIVDPTLTRYERSLALFGLPLSEPGLETNEAGDTVLTQWFERARFEWHPDNPQAYKVLLGLLGNEVRAPQTGQRGLPSTSSWVYTPGRITALAANSAPLFLSKGSYHDQIQVTADGTRMLHVDPISYGQDGSRLIWINAQTGERQVLHASNGIMLLPRISPDGTQIVVTIIEGPNWQLKLINTQRGTARVLRSGGTSNRVLAPLAWTPAGLFGQEIIWASDAPAQGVLVIDPSNGTTRSLSTTQFYIAGVSADGKQIALVSGFLPMDPTTAPNLTLAILDTTTGRESADINPPGSSLGPVVWSPDRERLMYVARDFQTGIVVIHVIDPDGASEETLVLNPGNRYGELRDVKWQNNGTLLVLFAAADEQLHLYTVPSDNLRGTLREIGTFPGGTEPGTGRILYVPR